MKKLVYILPAVVVVVIIVVIVVRSIRKSNIKPAPIPEGAKKQSSAIGSMAVAKNPTGVNIRRGPGVSTTILKKDATGNLGIVESCLPGSDAEGNPDNYTWYRITEQNGKFIGYVREDVVLLIPNK